MRSRKECQYRRKSKLGSPSEYSPVKGAPGLSELGATVGPLRDWAGSITAKDRLEPYIKKSVRKGEDGKIRLKDTFANGDGITGLNAKTPALSLGEALRINLDNLLPAGGMSPDGYSFRRSDARISTSHGDRLQ